MLMIAKAYLIKDWSFVFNAFIDISNNLSANCFLYIKLVSIGWLFVSGYEFLLCCDVCVLCYEGICCDDIRCYYEFVCLRLI